MIGTRNLPGADASAADAYWQALVDVLRVPPAWPTLDSEVARCPQFVHGQLLLIVLAYAGSHRAMADERFGALDSRRADITRRQRQLTEIVGNAIGGHRYRFHALASEHHDEHPDDLDLITTAEIALSQSPWIAP